MYTAIFLFVKSFFNLKLIIIYQSVVLINSIFVLFFLFHIRLDFGTCAHFADKKAHSLLIKKISLINGGCRDFVAVKFGLIFIIAEIGSRSIVFVYNGNIMMAVNKLLHIVAFNGHVFFGPEPVHWSFVCNI